MAHASRPPTPSSKVPTDSSLWRFKSLNAPTEWIESYRPGGFHPIHPGDPLDDGRYIVVRKLGYGAFSTVWLAQDTLAALEDPSPSNTERKGRPSLVAIKVARASTHQALDELRLYQMLASSAQDLNPMKHVVMPIHNFKQKGPNGEHQCLVFEPMGPCVGQVLEGIPAGFSQSQLQDDIESSPPPPPSPPAHSDEPPPPPPPEAISSPPSSDSMPGTPVQQPGSAALSLDQRKRLLKQLLLGLDCLHSSGIAHGDVNPGNMLLCIKPFSDQDIQSILTSSQSSPKSAPVIRLDGKEDIWAPRYLYLEQPLTDWLEVDAMMLAKVSDLGAGMFLMLWQRCFVHKTPSS